MRNTLTCLALGLIAALLPSAPGACEDKSEWIDLLGQDLKDWTRTEESKATPWRMTAERSLVCAPATESLMADNDFGDGTLKFEYRFRPTEQKKGYKASFGVRRTLAGAGCKIALGEGCGSLSATFQGSSDRTKTVEEKSPINPAHEIGAWNAVRVQLQGRDVQVWINDKQVATFNKCDTKRGLFVLDAEGWEIEFRAMMWKEEK